VITRYRTSNVNLRQQLKRIIKRAGLEPWPKLFQNLRSSRQTELAEKFAAHLVCAWIGNSEKIARDHYLQVRDADFQKAAQNPAQQAAELTGSESQTAGAGNEKRPVLPGDSSPCEKVQLVQVGAVGFVRRRSARPSRRPATTRPRRGPEPRQPRQSHRQSRLPRNVVGRRSS
jgi:hypothetical protein